MRIIKIIKFCIVLIWLWMLILIVIAGAEASPYKSYTSNNFELNSLNEISCNWHTYDDWKTCFAVLEVKPNRNISIRKSQLRDKVPLEITEAIRNNNLTFSFSQNYDADFLKEFYDTECIDEDNISCNYYYILARNWKSWKIYAEIPTTLNMQQDKWYAVGLTFDIPKYKSAHFNITLDLGTEKHTLDPEISACGTLIYNGTNPTIYTLTANLTSAGTCFTIAGSNITIDCNGFLINYSTDGTLGYAVNNSRGYSNITVKNCNITEGYYATNNKYAIYMNKSYNATIFNNTVKTSGTGSYPVYLLDANYSSVTNNNLTAINATTTYALDNLKSNFSYIAQNNLSAVFYTLIVSGSNSSIIDNNSIIVNSVEYQGIYLRNSNNNTFTNNRINTTRSNAFIVSGYNANHYSNNSIGTTNLAEGLPIVYNSSISNTVLYQNIDLRTTYGMLACGNCTNVTYDNVSILNDGINLFNSTNSNITNCNITTSKGIGVYLYNSSYNNISNNIVNTSGTSNYGVSMFNYSLYNLISSNSINTSGSTARGINLDTSANNNMTGNNITTTTGTGIYEDTSATLLISNNIIKTGGVGISLNSAGGSTTINLNNITTTGSSGYGIYIQGATPITINNTNITTGGAGAHVLYLYGSDNGAMDNVSIRTSSTGYGFYIRGSDSWKIKNSLINLTSSSAAYAMYFVATQVTGRWQINDSVMTSKTGADINFTVNGSVYLTNVTFNETDTFFCATNTCASSNLTVLWYLDAYVNDSAGNGIDLANVSAWDVNNNLNFTELTNSSGWITRKVLREYLENKTGKFYDTNWTVNGTKDGYSNDSEIVNLTGNKVVNDGSQVVLTLTSIDNIAPNVTLNSPIDYYNTSSNSLTFNCTAYDNVNVSNVTLYGNFTGSWDANETNSSPINNTPTIFSKTISEGRYVWNCRACDNSSNCNLSVANRTFTIDTTPPSISLNYPPDLTTFAFNYGSSSIIPLICTAIDNTNIQNISLYGNWGGWHNNETNSSPINNTETSFIKTFMQGTYIWNCEACNTYTGCSHANSNYTFSTIFKKYINSNCINSASQDNDSLTIFMCNYLNNGGFHVIME